MDCRSIRHHAAEKAVRLSGKDVMNDAPFEIGQPEVATGKAVGQPFMVDAEEMQDRRVKIVHMGAAFDRFVTELVGCSKAKACLDAAASEKVGESLRIVVTAVTPLGKGIPAEFSAPPDERLFEQSALLQVGQQRRDRLIGRQGMIGMLLNVAVLIPAGVGAVVGVVDLNETDSGLGKFPGHQALASEVVRGGPADPVGRLRRGGFRGHVHRFRGVRLHSPSEFVRLDDGIQLRVPPRRHLGAIEFLNEIKPFVLNRTGQATVGDVFDSRFSGGDAGAAHGRPLMDGRQKGTGVISRTAIGGRWADGDEGREIPVFGSQSVADPGSHRRSNQTQVAGMQKQCRRSVGDAVGVQAVKKTEVVNPLRDVRKKVGDKVPRLAVLPKLPRGLHDGFFTRHPGSGRLASIAKVEFPAVETVQGRFVVEGVDVAGAPLHEDEYHPLGSGGEHWRLPDGSSIPLRRRMDDSLERQCSETAGGLLQQDTAIHLKTLHDWASSRETHAQ